MNPAPQSLQVAALTDIGMRRANNQDSHTMLLADTVELWNTRGHLLLVADGMGGHAGGELASKLAADGISHLYHKYRELSPPEALERAVRETNAEVHRRGKANADFHNMGTTCTVLTLLPQGAMLAHIGDSRCYRLRGEQLEQLTFDHSVQWELRAAGLLKPGTELSSGIPKNQITRSLGPNAQVQTDLEGPWPLELGDTFLLCSDGLTGRVDDDEIGLIIGCLEPAEAVQVLVDLANLRGGPDNTTVIVARIAATAATTAANNPAPLTVGASKETRSVNPALWIVAAACGLIALVLLAVMQYIPAGIAAVGGIVSALIGVAQRYSGFKNGVALGGARRLGKGPHATIRCTPTHAFVEKLGRVVEELSQAIENGGWEIDRQKLAATCQKATSADQAGKIPEAVRQYGAAISFLMSQLRQSNQKKGSDSAIQY